MWDGKALPQVSVLYIHHLRFSQWWQTKQSILQGSHILNYQVDLSKRMHSLAQYMGWFSLLWQEWVLVSINVINEIHPDSCVCVCVCFQNTRRYNVSHHSLSLCRCHTQLLILIKSQGCQSWRNKCFVFYFIFINIILKGDWSVAWGGSSSNTA